MNKVIILFVFFALANTAVYFVINKRFIALNERINFLESATIYKENFNSKVITKKLNNKLATVLSLRCKDSNSKKVFSWTATGTKISSNIVLTADHAVSNHINTDIVEPISCNFYDEGVLVGEFIKNSKKKNYMQVNEKDIALIKVDFNFKGKMINNLKPEVLNITRGQPVILISHPLKFVDNRITTFGIIVNDNPDNKINGSRPKYWKNLVLTDMIASPGSSGAPVFNTDGSFIGIHVGGERDKGLNLNYQLIFEKDLKLALKDFSN